MLKHFKKQALQCWKMSETWLGRFSQFMQEAHHRVGAYDENKFVWTPDRFSAFIDRLGDAQKLALALLVTKGSVTDEQLRNFLKVPGNQALAGILSGISKQAVAL